MADRHLSQVNPIVESRLSLGHRMYLDLRSRTEYPAYYTGEYDTEMISAALRFLPAGGTFVDVGANIGFWTVPLAAKGVVHAYEPVPANRARLLDNVALNGVADNVAAWGAGLSDHDGEAEISLREDFARGAGTGNAAMVIDDSDRCFDVTKIALTTLDAEVERLGLHALDVVKVDIEGQEDRFLDGARVSLQILRPVVFVEWNVSYYERRAVDPTVVVGHALEGLGYTVLGRPRSSWTDVGRFVSDRAMDDLVLVPAERAGEAVSIMNGGTR